MATRYEPQASGGFVKREESVPNDSDAEVQHEGRVCHVHPSADATSMLRVEKVEHGLAKLEQEETAKISEKVELPRRPDETEHMVQVLENTERELLAKSEQTARRLERVKRQCIALEERVLVEAKKVEVLENTERELLTMSEQTTQRLDRIKRQCIALEERIPDEAKVGSAISARAAEAFTVRTQEPSSFLEPRGHVSRLSSSPSGKGQVSGASKLEKGACHQHPPVTRSPRPASPVLASGTFGERKGSPCRLGPSAAGSEGVIGGTSSASLTCLTDGAPRVRARSHDDGLPYSAAQENSVHSRGGCSEGREEKIKVKRRRREKGRRSLTPISVKRGTSRPRGGSRERAETQGPCITEGDAGSRCSVDVGTGVGEGASTATGVADRRPGRSVLEKAKEQLYAGIPRSVLADEGTDGSFGGYEQWCKKFAEDFSGVSSHEDRCNRVAELGANCGGFREFLALFGVACKTSFGRLGGFLSPTVDAVSRNLGAQPGKLVRSAIPIQLDLAQEAVRELVQPLCKSLQAPVRDWSMLVLGAMNFLAVAGWSTKPCAFPPQKVLSRAQVQTLCHFCPLLRSGFRRT